MQKFMVTIDDVVFRVLQGLTQRRNITMQELFRAVIIPDSIDRVINEFRRP
jgi:hypothetical protein